MTVISYGTAPLNGFKVKHIEDGKVRAMSVDGVDVTPTPRFWTSLCSSFSTYGLSTKLFRLFEHAEVFQRLSDRVGGEGKDRVRFALEDSGAARPTLLAVSNPARALVPYEKAKQMLARYDAGTVEYAGGIVRSTHAPQHMDDVSIAGDGFTHQYVMETPIDGFGKPLIYLSLLRQVCSNGMIGYARAFRTEINIGNASEREDDTMFSITRALDSFNNEEGYAALRDRFESAAMSWASIYEVNRVSRVIDQMTKGGMFRAPSVPQLGCVEQLATKRNIVLGGDGSSATDSNPINIRILRAFTQLSGNLCEIYGITHLDAMSQKKMTKVPARCSMYELLNFLTELATHYCDEKNGRLLQAEVGNFVSSEYDLEGTKETHPDFSDFFTKVD
jgi:hypothetical protein